MRQEEMLTAQNRTRKMRRSTRLFINVLGFSLNWSAAFLGLLIRNPGLVVLNLVFMAISYQGIHDVMALLDANEPEKNNEA